MKLTPRSIIVGLSAILLLIAIIWISQRSILDISIQSDASGTLTYRIVNTDTNDESVIETDKASLKRVVKKGSYQILVQHSERNAILYTKTKGFLATTKASSELFTERKRTFVGNNPGPCMQYLPPLVSFGCGDNLREVEIHRPATTTTPTYTERNIRSPFGGDIEGFVIFNNERLLLVHELNDQDIVDDDTHALYTLSDGLEIKSRRVLTELELDRNYTMTTYLDKLLFYSDSFDTLFTMSSKDGSLLTEKSLAPIDLETATPRSSKFGVATAVSLEGTDGEAEQEESQVIVMDGKSTSYTLPGQITDAVLCAKQTLCVLAAKTVKVYDLSENKTTYRFAIPSVESFEMVNESLIVASQRGILRIDPTKQTGRLDIFFKDYEVCGIQQQGSDYTVCATNTRQEKVALLISSNQEDDDSIDDAIAKLLENELFSSVSIYQNIIFVTPNLGDATVSPIDGLFEYTTSARQNAATKITQAIRDAGIDTSSYTIVNTLP